MTEEELNQELSTDELKNVAGGGIGPMGATGKVPLKKNVIPSAKGKRVLLNYLIFLET